MGNLIEIRPINSPKWHGKEGKESFSAKKKIQALVNGSTRKYTTGLSAEDIKYLKEKGCTYDLSDSFTAGVPHPFWDDKASEVVLENHTVVLNTENELDFIKSKIVKASKYVANSQAAIDDGDFPDATHFIFSEEEEEEALASRAAKRYAAGYILRKLSRERKLQVAIIIKGKNLRNKSDNSLLLEMEKIVNENTDDFLAVAKRDGAEITNEALVLEAILSNELNKKGHKIMYGDSVLGTSVSEVVAYLGEPEQQELKSTLIAKLRV